MAIAIPLPLVLTITKYKCVHVHYMYMYFCAHMYMYTIHKHMCTCTCIVYTRTTDQNMHRTCVRWPAVMTCTYAICGRAHMHIWDLRTCTYALRKCNCFQLVATWLQCVRHVVAMWQPRGNNCTSANCVHVCASPQIPDVHVCTSANRVCARHDSCNLSGHRTCAYIHVHM